MKCAALSTHRDLRAFPSTPFDVYYYSLTLWPPPCGDAFDLVFSSKTICTKKHVGLQLPRGPKNELLVLRLGRRTHGIVTELTRDDAGDEAPRRHIGQTESASLQVGGR